MVLLHTSSLLIMKYYIYIVACTACENMFTCYKVYTTSGSVQQKYIYIYWSYVQSTFAHYKVYATSGSVHQEQAGGRGGNIDNLGGPNQ